MVSDLNLLYVNYQEEFNFLIAKNIRNIKELFQEEILNVLLVMEDFDLEIMDSRIAFMLYYNITYYDAVLLESIPLNVDN